jgi:hypothetical protein
VNRSADEGRRSRIGVLVLAIVDVPGVTHGAHMLVRVCAAALLARRTRVLLLLVAAASAASCSDAQVANRDATVRHGAKENGP